MFFDYFLMILISLNSYMGFRNHVSGGHDTYMDKGPFFYEWFFESEEGGGWDWVGGS